MNRIYKQKNSKLCPWIYKKKTLNSVHESLLYHQILRRRLLHRGTCSGYTSRSCNVSRVTCHVSHATCDVSHVTCDVPHLLVSSSQKDWALTSAAQSLSVATRRMKWAFIPWQVACCGSVRETHGSSRHSRQIKRCSHKSSCRNLYSIYLRSKII